MVGGYNREVSYRKALRKKRIDHETYPEGTEWYNNLHQYSKNKIHCSCPLCAAKTKNKNGKRCFGQGGYNYKISDLKKIEDMRSQEEELNQEGKYALAAAGIYEDPDGQFTIAWQWEIKEDS